MAKASPRSDPGDRADIAEALHDAGLRRTPQRVAVLEQLERASGPLSHGQIAATLASAGFDRATVYRNLVDLVDAGLARRSDLGDHVWRFERARASPRGHSRAHPHFVCIDCGGVSCLPEESVRVRGGRGRPRALSRSALEVQLRGRCDGCAR